MACSTIRAQVRPRSSQVPRPRSGMRAPFASTVYGTAKPSAIPLWRVGRADDALVGARQRAQLLHLRVRQREIEQVEIFLQVFGIGGARNRDDVLLHQIAQRDLRRTLAVRLSDALQHGVAGRGAARDWAIGRDGKAVAAAGLDHLGAVDEGMDLDLVGDEW